MKEIDSSDQSEGLPQSVETISDIDVLEFSTKDFPKQVVRTLHKLNPEQREAYVVGFAQRAESLRTQEEERFEETTRSEFPERRFNLHGQRADFFALLPIAYGVALEAKADYEQYAGHLPGRDLPIELASFERINLTLKHARAADSEYEIAQAHRKNLAQYMNSRIRNYDEQGRPVKQVQRTRLAQRLPVEVKIQPLEPETIHEQLEGDKDLREHFVDSVGADVIRTTTMYLNAYESAEQMLKKTDNFFRTNPDRDKAKKEISDVVFSYLMRAGDALDEDRLKGIQKIVGGEENFWLLKRVLADGERPQVAYEAVTGNKTSPQAAVSRLNRIWDNIVNLGESAGVFDEEE